MPDLRKTRQNLKTVLAILAGVDLLAAIVYFSPLVGSAESRRQELYELQSELSTKTRQVVPLKDLPHKVEIASRQIADFYKKRIPDQESEIVDRFDKLAQANGVTVEQSQYKKKDEGPGHLRPVEIQAELGGSYTSLARFINALERDQMFFIINGVALGGEPQGPVKLSMKLEAYLKAES